MGARLSALGLHPARPGEMHASPALFHPGPVISIGELGISFRLVTHQEHRMHTALEI